ncbi:MAG: ATP-binding protein [Flavobacteriales bacterium]|nr:ATP-binding protein [Flavobacteriales bacterium]
MSKLRLVAILILGSLGGPALHASNLGDSVRYVLDTDASTQERVDALMQLALRTRSTDPTSALAHAHNAVRLAEQSGDQLLLHEALSVTRGIQAAIGLHADHLRTTLSALAISRSLQDPARMAEDLQAVSTAYRVNQRMDKALEEARNALAIAVATKDADLILRSRVFLVRTMVEAGRTDEALRMAELALTTPTNPDRAMIQARTRMLMAKALMAQGKPLDAWPYLVMAGRVINASGTPDDRIELALAQARASARAGRHADAIAMMNLATGLFDLTICPDLQLELLRTRYELALARHDDEAALHGLQGLYNAEDSFKRAESNMVLAGMQVMYELEKKDQLNSDLAIENKEKEATIEEQRISNRLLLFIVLLFVGLTVALFFIARMSIRTARRSRLKTALIQRQKDENHAKNLELQRQNMRLAEALMSDEQKDIVIKEIHHRVKNNMQVIESLFAIQAPEGSNRAWKEAQGRLKAMALVHEATHKVGGEESIPVQPHFEELARNALVAYGCHDRVSVFVDAHRIAMHAADLMPLSLLVNELITNAIKYAFEDREAGSIRIGLRNTDGTMELTLSDDGVGLDPSASKEELGSIGSGLIHSLAQQLNGKMTFAGGAGTTFRLAFIPDRMEQRLAS